MIYLVFHGPSVAVVVARCHPSFTHLNNQCLNYIVVCEDISESDVRFVWTVMRGGIYKQNSFFPPLSVVRTSLKGNHWRELIFTHILSAFWFLFNKCCHFSISMIKVKCGLLSHLILTDLIICLFDLFIVCVYTPTFPKKLTISEDN